MAQEHTVSFRKPSHSRHERNALKGDFRCMDGESLWTARGRASLEKHWFHFLELNYYVTLKLLIGCSSMSAPSGIILASSRDVMFQHFLIGCVTGSNNTSHLNQVDFSTSTK